MSHMRASGTVLRGKGLSTSLLYSDARSHLSQQLAPCTKSRWRTGCANGPADLLCLGLSGPSEPISTPYVPDRTNLLLVFLQASGVMGCLVLWGMRRLLRREWLRAVSCQNVTEGIGSSAFQLRFGTFCSVCRCHSLSRVADCVFFTCRLSFAAHRLQGPIGARKHLHLLRGCCCGKQ